MSQISPAPELPSSPKHTMRNLFKDADKSKDGNLVPAENHRFNLKERMVYVIDRGFESQCFQAALIVLILGIGIAVGGVLIFIGDRYVQPEDVLNIEEFGINASFSNAVWKSWTYMADPGTHADVDSNVYFRLSAFITAIMGILLMAAIIGFVVDAIKKKMDALDTGRGKVVEKDHMLVMGWTEKTVQVIDQLALMMESEGGGTIVLCSAKPKRDALDEVREQCTLLNSRIVVRTGSISSQSDLSRLAAPFARAIIVLAPEGAADKADASVLRCVLSLKGLARPLKGHIVAEMRDIDNTSLVEVVGGTSVETIVSHDVVGRLMIQSARQRGLADVYACLLGFEGDEIYLQKWPQFAGKSFDYVLRSFADAIPIGVATRTSSGAMHVQLNPPDNRIIGLSEAIVVIAEDDDSYFPSEVPEPYDSSSGLALPGVDNTSKQSEQILMTGWRRDIDDIIVLLDELVSPGSELHMLNELDVEERNDRLVDGGLDPDTGLHNLTIIHHIGNPAVRRKLDEVKVSKFDSVLILSDEAFEEDMMHSDSHSLAILLLIRDLQLHDAEFHKKQAKSKKSVLTRMSNFGAMAHGAGLKFSKASASIAATTTPEAKSLPPVSSPGNAVLMSMKNNVPGKKRNSLLAAAKGFKAKSDSKKKTKVQQSSCIVTCEILDPTTHTMIMQNPAIAHMSDYVLSNNTVSKVLAMVAESREVKAVLKELLGSSGCDIAVWAAKRYTHRGDNVSFWELAGQVRKRGEICIGYLLDDELVLNPKGEERHAKRNWNLEKDRVIIVTKGKNNVSRSRSSQ